MNKSISIIFIYSHKFIANNFQYSLDNKNESFNIFTFNIIFIFSIFSSGKLHYLGCMNN